MINAILWSVLTIMIVYMGILFSIELKFPQLNVLSIIKSLKTNRKGITPLKTLCLTLAGRIGVGSIAGVALAIYLGGPGTIFWMWVISFLSAPLAYSETLLGIKYKVKKNGEYFGGPSYYITDGLLKKRLAFLYAIIVIFSYFFGFIPIQSNTILNTINLENEFILGLFLMFITLVIIFGGINKITKVTSKLVPIMTIFYFSLSLITIFFNIDKIPFILKEIVSSAFDIKPFITGFLMNLLIGVQRGIFSNESGLGLGAIASSSSNNANGSKSGYIQILGVYITSFIICTSTAFLIFTSNYNMNYEEINGIEVALQAFSYHFNNFGKLFLTISICLFAFSTIITGYYYLESSFSFVLKKYNHILLKIFTGISVLVGSVSSPNFIWNIIDTLVALLGIINIYALGKLKKEIKQYHENYGKI